jgi:hypothetical protein
MPDNPSATDIAAAALLNTLYADRPAVVTAAVNAWLDGLNWPGRSGNHSGMAGAPGSRRCPAVGAGASGAERHAKRGHR